MDTVTAYRRDITNLPQPLTRPQEAAATRDELVQANLRYVMSVAATFQGRGLALEDLIGAGNLGLIQAAERFNARRGCKFISYAVWWIRQAIQVALHEHNARITAPVYRDSLAGQLAKRKNAVAQQTGKTPRDEEIIVQLTDDDPQQVRCQLATCNVVSLDAPGYTDQGQERSIGQTLAMALESRSEDEVQTTETRKLLGTLLQQLEARERRVLIRRFGLDGELPENLEVIGERYQLSRERIRQIQKTALGKIRRYLRQNHLNSQLHELLELTA